MFILLWAAIAVAVVAWLVALVTCVQLFRLRLDDISGWDMAFNGMVWFRADTFKPVARPLHRRFLLAFAAFFAAVIVMVLFTILIRA